MENIEIKILSTIPDNLISVLDTLLEENGSYNRIGNTSALPEDIQDCLYNKSDRAGFVLAYHGEILVGSVIVFKRVITFQNQTLILGGIGGVGTKKEYRKKGIGTMMLGTAMNMLHDLGCDIAFLRTDTTNQSLVSIYKRIGFEELGRSDTYKGGLSGKVYTDIGGMIAPILSQEKYERMLRDTAIFDQGTGTW